jgi:adenylate cyclase
MDARTWQIVKKWLADAVELPKAERAAFIARRCPDEALRRELLELLTFDAALSGIVNIATVTPGTRRGSPVSLAAGTQVGRYRVVARMSSGGMGEVHRARDLALDRDVALKIVAAGSTHDRASVRRFIREAQAASALNHPNIVSVFDVGECEAGPFLVMELVEGRTLRELIHASHGLEVLKQVASQTARAIAAAHAAGILHRDIKPENVMVRRDGYVKVLDFGLARAISPFEDEATTASASRAAAAVTSSGEVFGTLAYMSPEQARNDGVGAPSDVFALGVVFYELLTGHHPFESGVPLTMIARMLSNPPPPPSSHAQDVPPALDDLILCMLDKAASQRPTAAEVDAQLEAIFDGAVRSRRHGAAITVRHTVGRDLALAQLRRAFESTAEGQGAVIALPGEPGIGKTTIAEAFLDWLSASGELCYVGRGRCSERHAGSGAYLPWLEALDALWNQRETPAARTMKALAPTWYAQVAPPDAGDTPESRALTVNRAGTQEWMKRELCAFLEELARHRPVVLFFDDLHWADESTVDILAYVADRMRSQRILAITTYRPSELLLGGHVFLPLKLDLEARGICCEVPLEFLTAADVARYLDLECPGHRFPLAFAALVHDKTEGNPLFMVDLVRSFRDRGVIRSNDGSWELSQLPAEFEGDIPVSIRSMIELKIRRLDDADRRLLTVASVAGAEFTSAVVARVLAIDQADLEDRLNELGRIHALVRSVREEELPDCALSMRYRFVHVLYQNALYASLGPNRRALLSLRVAEALLAVYGGQSTAYAVELGCLFEAGRDFSRAADYFLAASLRSRQIYAHREALALAERAITMLRMLPDTLERTTRELIHLLAIVMPTHAIKGYAVPELDEIFERIRRLCVSLGENPQVFLGLSARSAYHFMRAELVPQEEAIEQMRRLSDMTGDPMMAIWTEWAHGSTCSHFGRCLEDAMRHLDRGALLYDTAMYPGFMQTGFDAGIGCGFQGARVAWMLGRSDEAASRIAAVVAETRRLGHPMLIAFSLFFQAWIRQHGRDADGVLDVMRQLMPVIEQYGYPDIGAWANILNGWAEAQTGRAAEGEAAIRTSLAVLDMIGIKLMRPNFLALLAEAIAAQGRTGEALAVLDEAAAIAERTEERCYLSEIHRLAGEWLPSRDRLQLAIAIAHEQGARAFEQRAAASLGRVTTG